MKNLDEQQHERERDEVVRQARRDGTDVTIKLAMLAAGKALRATTKPGIRGRSEPATDNETSPEEIK